jgi:hypothetical protein
MKSFRLTLLAILLIAPAVSQATIIAVYQSSNRTVLLSDQSFDGCAGTGWKNGGVITGPNQIFTTCWGPAKNNMIAVCAIYNHRISGDCFYYSRSLFVDPASLPQSAFPE